MAAETMYEKCERRARNSYGCTTEEEVSRVTNHLFAKELAGGATLARIDGKTVVKRPASIKPHLP